jgi:O-antigen ligase
VNTLLVIVPGVTILLFILNLFYKGSNVQSCLIFILTFLPLMDLKVTKEAMGGFKTFDVITLYCLVFLFKDFITINLKSRNNLFFGLFVLLVIIILIGGLASEFPGHAYLSLTKTLSIFIFGRFLMTECMKDPTFHYEVIKALKTAYIASLIFLFIQVIIGLKFTFYPGLGPNTIDPVFHIIRYPGVFFDSQAHGQYLAIGSFLFLYFEPDASKKTMIFNYTIFVIAIIAINLAGSRAAFGGFAVGALVAFYMYAKNYRIIGSVIIIAAYIAFETVSIHSRVFERSKNLNDDFLFREGIWKEAFDISQKHPLLGIGSGNYQNYVIRHNQDQYLEIEDGELVYFDQPENGYLKIMVELGFIGFAIFALYMIIPLVKGLLYFVRGYDSRIAFLMSSLIAFLIAFNTVYSIYDNRLLIMVACLVVLIITYPINEYYANELGQANQE